MRYKKAIELGRKARQNGGIRMLVDKNGKEITAGCKILVGETVFKVWGDAPVNHKSSPKSGHKE